MSSTTIQLYIEYPCQELQPSTTIQQQPTSPLLAAHWSGNLCYQSLFSWPCFLHSWCPCLGTYAITQHIYYLYTHMTSFKSLHHQQLLPPSCYEFHIRPPTSCVRHLPTYDLRRLTTPPHRQLHQLTDRLIVRTHKLAGLKIDQYFSTCFSYPSWMILPFSSSGDTNYCNKKLEEMEKIWTFTSGGSLLLI